MEMFAFSFAPPAIFRVRFQSPKGHKNTKKVLKNLLQKVLKWKWKCLLFSFAPPAAIFRHSQVNDPNRMEETASLLHSAWSGSEPIETEEKLIVIKAELAVK